MKNILIIKTSAAGDIIHTYPVIEFLRKKFPHAAIDWVVESSCASLVSAHPDIDRTLVVETKQWRKKAFSRKTLSELKGFIHLLREREYDVVFDLQGNFKSGLLLSLAKSPQKVGFGFNSIAEWPNLLFTNLRFNPLEPVEKYSIRLDYLLVVCQFFDGGLNDVTLARSVIANPVTLKLLPDQKKTVDAYVTDNQMPVMVCPGSAWPNKQLDIKTLIEFLRLVHKALGCKFLLTWGSPEEYEMVKALNREFPHHSTLINKMSLPSLQHLMQSCKLVIAMDSLPLHLCGTTSTPSFSVFGPSSANKYQPPGKQHRAFQGTCPYGRTFTKRCPILRTCPTGACIRSLSADDLFSHFMQWWPTV